MYFTDTHIHLQDFKLLNATEIIKKSVDLGVVKFLCVSTSPKDWKKVETIAIENKASVVPAIGVHPWYIEETSSNWAEILEENLQKNSNLLIGECGLDGAKERNVEAQIPFFVRQIELAEKYNRPIIVHSVQAVEKTLTILEGVNLPFVWHSFNGSLETALKILKLGGYIGVNEGFFKSKHWQNVLHGISQDNILVESDAPYQYENISVIDVSEKLAEFYHISTDIFYQNFIRFSDGKK